jgi:tyrosyl-DNA phosphodiesterase-1
MKNKDYRRWLDEDSYTNVQTEEESDDDDIVAVWTAQQERKKRQAVAINGKKWGTSPGKKKTEEVLRENEIVNKRTYHQPVSNARCSEKEEDDQKCREKFPASIEGQKIEANNDEVITVERAGNSQDGSDSTRAPLKLPSAKIQPLASVNATAISVDTNDDKGDANRNRSSSLATKKSAKRQRQEQTHSSARIESPIKLFATVQDILARCQNPNQGYLRHVMTLREMLGLDYCIQNPHMVAKGMEWFVATNYLVDFAYVLEKVPELTSLHAIIFFYQNGNPSCWGKNSGAVFRRLDPGDDPSETNKPTGNPLKYKFKFGGTHHSKMFLVGFTDKVRVIIHTSNILGEDFETQANAAYIQDFPLKIKTLNIKSGDIPDFERTLVSYIETYGYNQARHWSEQRKRDGSSELTLMQQLSLYDFSSAKVILVPSCPGYYNMDRYERCYRQGYFKVKQSIEKYVSIDPGAKFGSVVCQFSSIGSLSAKWMHEFVKSLSVPVVRKNGNQNFDNLADAVKLVYPTVGEIRSSITGYRGGGSVPGREKNLKKNFLNPLYCKWSSSNIPINPIFKGKNVPHIKSYYQLRADDSFAWFFLGSHNLSKPAWGQVTNGRYGPCFQVSSWELGVFLCPELFSTHDKPVSLVPIVSPIVSDFSNGTELVHIPLPYPSHPQPYERQDEPWVVCNIRNEKKYYVVPDSFGQHSP